MSFEEAIIRYLVRIIGLRKSDATELAEQFSLVFSVFRDGIVSYIKLAKAKNIGVLTMKPFSGGVIEEAAPALRFVLQTKEIVPIPGSETLERARENWKIFTEGYSLTERDKERIEAIRKEFDRQFCRRCDYCQPCTEKINIQQALALKAIIKGIGVHKAQKGWVKDLIEKARNCSECGECLERCPYQLPIPDLIKENLAWYDGLKNV